MDIWVKVVATIDEQTMTISKFDRLHQDESSSDTVFVTPREIIQSGFSPMLTISKNFIGKIDDIK